MYNKNADQLFNPDPNMTFGIRPSYCDLVADLGNFDLRKRLDALIILNHLAETGEISLPRQTEDTNNHVHTWYSFSPYTPSMAVWIARMNGLSTVGIVDHDSVGGADEFVQAGRIMRIATTVGAEVRANFSGTPLEGRYINNPDEPSVGYIAAHGIPLNRTELLDRELLADIRYCRNLRTEKETQSACALLPEEDLCPDFWNEVIDYSLYCFGTGKTDEGRTVMSGSVTERHLLFAIAKRMVKKYGRGESLLAYLRDTLGIPVSEKAAAQLLDTAYPHYEYDVINVLKGDFISKIYYPSFGDSTLAPDALPIEKVVSSIRAAGALPSYCYLGDVGESPTGDKKAQKFEDGYLDELFPLLKDMGFEAVAYMPSRNTAAQLARLRELCERYALIQISGEDINQPRQAFVCEKLRESFFSHLADSTWALVGHEAAAAQDPEKGISSARIKKAFPDLKKRIAHFREIGMSSMKRA